MEAEWRMTVSRGGWARWLAEALRHDAAVLAAPAVPGLLSLPFFWEPLSRKLSKLETWVKPPMPMLAVHMPAAPSSAAQHPPAAADVESAVGKADDE